MSRVIKSNHIKTLFFIFFKHTINCSNQFTTIKTHTEIEQKSKDLKVKE